MNQDERTTVLPVLPLDDAVVLPGHERHLPRDLRRSRPRRSTGAVEGRIAARAAQSRAASRPTASWPQIVGEVTLPDGTRGVAVEAMHRAELGPADRAARPACA